MPSWRHRKEGGDGIATITANREVGAQIDVEVTAATTLEFQVAVARQPGIDIQESLAITLNGKPIEAREIIGAHETRIHSVDIDEGTVSLSYSATVSGEAEPAPVRDIDLITYLRPSRYAEADKFFGFAATEFAQYTDPATLLEKCHRGWARAWITLRAPVIRSTAPPTPCWRVPGCAVTTRTW